MKRIITFSLITILLIVLTNSCEKPYDPVILAEISTTEVSLITEASAQSGGNISSDEGIEVTVRGVCWSISPYPTIADSVTIDASGSGGFTSIVTSLTPNTTYYLRAYATNKYGTAYGLQETFTTKSIGLTTKEITEVTVNSAKCGGIIDISVDSSKIEARGVCWSTQQNPTIENNKTTDDLGSGEFISALTDLEINTKYYIRIYATYGGSTYYGNELSFKTRDGNVSLTTQEVSSITDNSSMAGGDITDDGGAEVSLRGVCWSTTPNPTTDDSKTTDGSGIGSFTSSVTGLTINSTYYLRAYATNSVGTSYGNQQSFNTLTYTFPTITTTPVTNISFTSATFGGDITYDGGSPVTDRGVCWSTSPNPTIADDKTSNSTGTGIYTSDVSGLTKSTKYYVRAYATNIAGTIYGNEVSFTTPSIGAGEVLSTSTGRIWMDRNLGATRVATKSADAQAYGDLYQWGRDADGHQKRNSGTTSSLSNSNTPGHGNFIVTSSSPFDWRSPQDNDLWQGVNGANNPCPSGFRLPTESEWNVEMQSWSNSNATGAFSSPLKLPTAGNRLNSGAFEHVDLWGHYWSSTLKGSNPRRLNFDIGSVYSFSVNRASGNSVRCIKD